MSNKSWYESWYKVINDQGKSCSGGNEFQWSLPTLGEDGNWTPGEWHEHEGPVVLCESGFHVTDNPVSWLSWVFGPLEMVYECEIAQDAKITAHDPYHSKMAVSVLRLTKPFTGTIKHPHAEQWYRDGKLHRDDDLPALIWVDGGEFWRQNGKPHRYGDQPAAIYTGGDQRWLQHGELHRENDQPAIIWSNGSQEWYKNGRLHRDGGKPAVIRLNAWRKEHNGILIETGDLFEWWEDGKRIRSEIDNIKPKTI